MPRRIKPRRGRFTGGTGDAAVIGIVALLLQQFDNELLAPSVYGRMTRLHPVVVLGSVADARSRPSPWQRLSG